MYRRKVEGVTAIAKLTKQDLPVSNFAHFAREIDAKQYRHSARPTTPYLLRLKIFKSFYKIDARCKEEVRLHRVCRCRLIFQAPESLIAEAKNLVHVHVALARTCFLSVIHIQMTPHRNTYLQFNPGCQHHHHLRQVVVPVHLHRYDKAKGWCNSLGLNIFILVRVGIPT